MMSTQPFPAARLRLPALLFIASPVAFIAVIVTAILGFSGVGNFDKITPAQMASIPVAWILGNAFGGIAVLLGAAGVVTLSTILKETRTRLLAWIALVSALVVIVVCVLFVVLRVSVTGFTEATLGLNSYYRLSDWSFVWLAGPLVMAGTMFVSIGLFASGLLRRTGLVLAILSSVLLFLSIVRGFPPFVYAILWLALGIGLLLRKE